MTEEPSPAPPEFTALARFENGIKLLLIFGSSLILWAVIGVHLSYHPVLVFGMIALYNEHLRDYWSILANESAEYGVWPGLLSVLQQEVFWILTISLALTLVFWGLRKAILKSNESFSELIAVFLWEQVLALGVAIIACTLGAIVVGSSFVFGMAFQTPISLEIGLIIEIVASSLLIFSLILSLSFWYLDLPAQKKVRRQAQLTIAAALPIACLALFWAANSFSIETDFTSQPALPADFRVYSEATQNNLQVGTDPSDQGPAISVFDRVSPVGQTHFSAAETQNFSWPNEMLGDRVTVMRSLYFAGSDIVPGFMPALFHRRPNEIELDVEDRKLYLTYALSLQRAPSKSEQTTATRAPADWLTLSENWHHRSLTGSLNGGWGIRLYCRPDPEQAAAEQVVSYTVFASAPPRLETLMQNGKRYSRTLPFSADIHSLSWHRQSAASLWINETPAFYFFESQPDHLEVINPAQEVLSFKSLEFVPE